MGEDFLFLGGIAMNINFLSDRANELHKEYLRQERLKYSILEKSIPKIVGKDMREISGMRLRDKDEILTLKCNILCHDIFFESFGKGYGSSSLIKSQFRSEASFFYEVSEYVKAARGDFLFISSSGAGVGVCIGDGRLILRLKNPVFVIDLCEHAYFLDYGFEREAYVKTALAHLNLSKLDKFCQTRIEKP